jgi:hypothetical protein
MHVNNPALLDRADELWAEGRHQRALQQLRALVDGDPSQLDVRGRLAERYRELGNPDHAGRWGIGRPSSSETALRGSSQPDACRHQASESSSG